MVDVCVRKRLPLRNLTPRPVAYMNGVVAEVARDHIPLRYEIRAFDLSLEPEETGCFS